MHPPSTALRLVALPFSRRLGLGLVLINLFVLAFAYWTLQQARDHYEERARITGQNLSQVLERGIAASIDKIDLVLATAQLELEREIREGGLSDTETNAYLQRAIEHLPEAIALRATDAAGKVRWGVKPGAVYEAGDRDYFLALRDDPHAGLAISRPVLGRVTGKWMIFLARRYHDSRGKFAGVILAGVELDFFNRQFASLDVGRGGVVSLRNMEHGLIARVPAGGDPAQSIGKPLVSDKYREMVARQPLGGMYFAANAIDGKEKLYHYRKVGRYPLVVSVALGTEDYLGEWRSDQLKTGVLVLFFLLISCTGGVILVDLWRRQEEMAANLEQRVLERTAALTDVNEELRRKSQQLIQAEKLSALGSLVAGVAHELNTPIGNMRLTASALSGRAQDFVHQSAEGKLRLSQLREFAEYCSDAADLIDRAAVRSGELIQSFKQVAVDQTSLRRRRFDLRHTIDQTVLTLSPLLKRKPYTVEVNVPEGIEMDGYPGPLEQVITNFVTNSLAHAFAGREEGHMRISARARGDQVELVYRDDGSGIPADIQARVFDPFFTTKLGQGGSGLGLYTVYNIVTGILGGSVRLDSAPGQGASFTLILPRVSPMSSQGQDDDALVNY